jgi:DNA-directed RNA polymerase subunit beta'
LLDVNYFDELRIGLATAEQIRMWSNGEVRKPETINYRTLKPEKDGLFCEKIFGPTRDWECYCGKYKRVRFKGIICERCGVEVTRAKVRRERMGHIELAAPVTHIWYVKGVPSRLGYLLDMAPKDLEKIIYFAANVVTWVDEDKRHTELPRIESEIQHEREQIEHDKQTKEDQVKAQLEANLAELEAQGAKADQRRKTRNEAERAFKDIREKAATRAELLDRVLDVFKNMSPKQLLADDQYFRELRERFGEYFSAGMGAEAMKDLLLREGVEEEQNRLREVIATSKGQKQQRAIKRLRVVTAFVGRRNSPLGMVLDCVPVIPPDLRPMVQLDGGRFATSDLNDLYRRVINRNNRLKRLLDLGAPEIIVNNEKRMLQEAVDALFDNGRRGRPVTGPGNRPLKSLSDMLKGKQGRFRQNLLGKRVDYSGRSVIVVGPELKLHQCGLPKQMALELFKPFVMKRLVDLQYAQNIKSAKRMVERSRPQVWDVLEEVIREHPVLLNRAPTLHRLGIQAFEPVLVEGKAIQIHPLVCSAFNADFDGDQMAVHVPLSAEAQAEARILMLSINNILSPAHGRPIAVPTHEMVLGIYFLSYKDDSQVTGTKGKASTNGDRRLPTFGSVAEAIMAYDFKDVTLQQPINVRLTEAKAGDGPRRIETTVGRLLINEAFPETFPYVNETMQKKEISNVVTRVADRFSQTDTAETLNNLKNLGFHWASRAGVTVSISDVLKPPNKQALMDEFERRSEKVESQYRKGIITDDERRQELIEIWTEATDEVTKDMVERFKQSPFNPIYMMATSGARGNMTQVRQIAGMRGLVANPKGDIIPRPIKANFREGLSVLEYFISTHGARKGLADTALRTADSGYLTRRLVDVTQDVIVREPDCGTERGIMVAIAERRPVKGGKKNETELRRSRVVETQALSRVTAEDVADSGGEVVVPANTQIDDDVVDAMVAAGVEEVRCRSVLTCEAKVGVCQLCYGRSMANNRVVDIGEAVGIIAAQSIGEPGTQLTMRTFHTGGVAGEDITHGLPRVVELFEARTPKGMTPIAEFPGRVSIEQVDKGIQVTVTSDEGEEWQAIVSRRARLKVEDGQQVDVGHEIVEGTPNPKEMLRILGIRATQIHLVEEVQKVYTSQGVTIHDKHIELIVRQMLKRVTVLEGGDTDLLPGELVERATFERANREALEQGKTPASGRPELLGITKASLATESWLSAASFQETTRVLTEAAIEGKSDSLIGLKENVIIGKLIPAGTGMVRYRSVNPIPTEVPAAYGGMDVFGEGGFDQAGFGEGYDQSAYEQGGYEQQPQYYTDGQTYYDESGQPLAPVEGNGTVVDIAAGEEGYTPAYYDGGAGGGQQEETPGQPEGS